jgi:hypothetical protein
MPTILLKTLAPLTETSDAFDYADQGGADGSDGN